MLFWGFALVLSNLDQFYGFLWISLYWSAPTLNIWYEYGLDNELSTIYMVWDWVLYSIDSQMSYQPQFKPPNMYHFGDLKLEAPNQWLWYKNV